MRNIAVSAQSKAQSKAKELEKKAELIFFEKGAIQAKGKESGRLYGWPPTNNNDMHVYACGKAAFEC